MANFGLKKARNGDNLTSQFHSRCENVKKNSIGTSYLAKFQKRAVTNLKNYSTKNDENLRKCLKEGNSNHHERFHSKRANISARYNDWKFAAIFTS